MAGQVKHIKIFSRHRARPRCCCRCCSGCRSKNTDALISAVADVMRDHGIELIDSTAFLTPLLARAGVLTSAAPTAEERRRPRVRLPHGRRDRRPRHRPDHRREERRGGRRRGDGGHRRGHSRAPGSWPAPACASSRWPSRTRTCASTCRSSAWRRSRRCAAAGATALSVDAGRDADARRRRPSIARRRRGGHRHRRARPGGTAAEDGVSDRRLRVAVIGVGHLGRHHARILATVPGVDARRRRRRQRAAGAGDRGGARAPGAHRASRDLLGQVDAGRRSRRRPRSHAEIATPVPRARHPGAGREAAGPLARRGRRDHRRGGAGRASSLAVGHTERFNPAVDGRAAAP